MRKKNLLKEILKKEVKKMKKLMIMIMAIAMVVSFMPKADAGETAELGLKVTFAVDEPLKLWTEPEGPFEVKEGETLKFTVIAEDKDANEVKLTTGDLPEGARFMVCMPIPYPRNRVVGTFIWTPKIGQAHSDSGEPYVVVFSATSDNGELGIGMMVRITVHPGEPVISIRVVPDVWSIENIGLGETIENVTEDGMPIQRIENDGRDALVEIRYVMPGGLISLIRPDRVAGHNRFASAVVKVMPNGLKMYGIIPPDGNATKVGKVGAGKAISLHLAYMSPTSVGFGRGVDGEGYEPLNVTGHSQQYELRACLAIKE